MTETKETDSKRKGSRQTTLTEDFGFPKIQTYLNIPRRDLNENHQVPETLPCKKPLNNEIKSDGKTEQV